MQAGVVTTSQLVRDVQVHYWHHCRSCFKVGTNTNYHRLICILTLIELQTTVRTPKGRVRVTELLLEPGPVPMADEEQQEVTDGVSSETLTRYCGRSQDSEGYHEEGRHGGHSLWQGPENGEATLGADRYTMSGCEPARAVARLLRAEGAQGRYSSTELVWRRRTQAPANRAEYTSPKARDCCVCQPLRSAPECEEYG
jgi:hypothetical protein